MYPDKRALKILFDTYWSSSEWKSAGNLNWIPETPKDDFDFAIRSGTMFHERTLAHSTAVRRICELRGSLSPKLVGQAFLASLQTGEIGLRSALGSLAIALHMPFHDASLSQTRHRCDICGGHMDGGGDLNVLSFERHKWGGVRHEQPAYIAFDLERFVAEVPKQSPGVDLSFLTGLLSTIDSMPSTSKPADLARALRPLVLGNDAQRRKVVSILGYAGVLQIPEHRGFFRTFTRAIDRKETPWHKDDWDYPARWWQGGYGADPEAVEFWFGLPARAA